MPKQLSPLTRKQGYKAYLKSNTWRTKREKVLVRDGCCTRCQSRRNLQVHHLTYANVYAEPLEDLVTLCENCHRWTHHQKHKVKHKRPKRPKQKQPVDYMKFKTKPSKSQWSSRARNLHALNQALHEKQVRAREKREAISRQGSS